MPSASIEMLYACEKKEEWKGNGKGPDFPQTVDMPKGAQANYDIFSHYSDAWTKKEQSQEAAYVRQKEMEKYDTRFTLRILLLERDRQIIKKGKLTIQLNP